MDGQIDECKHLKADFGDVCVRERSDCWQDCVGRTESCEGGVG